MIVWEDDRNGNKDIYFGKVDEFRELSAYTGKQITTNPASQEKPSISGDYIVWQDYRNGNWDIYLYKRSTGKRNAAYRRSGQTVDAHRPRELRRLVRDQ